MEIFIIIEKGFEIISAGRFRTGKRGAEVLSDSGKEILQFRNSPDNMDQIQIDNNTSGESVILLKEVQAIVIELCLSVLLFLFSFVDLLNR